MFVQGTQRTTVAAIYWQGRIVLGKSEEKKYEEGPLCDAICAGHCTYRRVGALDDAVYSLRDAGF